MSIMLNNGTQPEVNIKSGFTKGLRIGNVEISPEDFNVMVLYYMTNTDLIENDKRLELYDQIKI